MKKYYVSHYLNVIPLGKSFLLFNGINGCIDEVTQNLGTILNNKNILYEHDFSSQAEMEYLLKRAHITTLTPEDEKKEFKKVVRVIDDLMMKTSKTQGALMLLLSYACNLKCHYCYQKPIRKQKQHNAMDSDFIDTVYNTYFNQLMPTVSPENVSVTLYGGEPFLPRNNSAIRKILHYAEKYSQHVGAVSNCVDIEEVIALSGPIPGKINFIQVSLDSDETHHNTSRIGSNKTPTFQTIINNIHRLLDKKVNLNIRINIESVGIDHVESLLTLLDEQEIINHPYAYIYIHPLHNHFNQTDSASFLGAQQVAAKLKTFPLGKNLRHPIKRKAEGLRHLLTLQRGIGLRRTRFCMQNIPNNFLLDPFGDIYGCYEEAGRDQYKIGYLKDGVVQFTELYKQYQRRSLEAIPQCLECSVALLCAGECGVQAREQRGDIFVPYCDQVKDTLYEAMKHLYYESNEQTGYNQSFTLLHPHL